MTSKLHAHCASDCYLFFLNTRTQRKHCIYVRTSFQLSYDTIILYYDILIALIFAVLRFFDYSFRDSLIGSLILPPRCWDRYVGTCHATILAAAGLYWLQKNLGWMRDDESSISRKRRGEKNNKYKYVRANTQDSSKVSETHVRQNDSSRLACRVSSSCHPSLIWSRIAANNAALYCLVLLPIVPAAYAPTKSTITIPLTCSLTPQALAIEPLHTSREPCARDFPQVQKDCHP